MVATLVVQVAQAAVSTRVQVGGGAGFDGGCGGGVTAGLALPWSSSVVEGHVNRIKTIKRQMYGRAAFTLLRKRVLCS
ncbi:hypothetical protein ACFXA3_33055 [Streptomyces sp. NPDC059456]|uniref:hypothetical protein n=1 Tax=Streptomyces sp. NPDC059456 TaxID=3346838 RepID=UPI0036780B09